MDRMGSPKMFIYGVYTDYLKLLYPDGPVCRYPKCWLFFHLTDQFKFKK